MGNINKGVLRQAVLIGGTSFVIAILMSIGSGVVVNSFHNLVLALILLILIITVGIIFDLVGVAVTVAEEHHFHAKASKKVKGSKQANNLIAQADKVASFCNDVVGDICGTVSGSLGAAIVYMIVTNGSRYDQLVTTLMTGIIAALTVGGKAAGKKLALEQSERVVFRVARVLAWVEDTLGFAIVRPKGRRRARERVTR
ncbi:MAG TPA: CNNM domain-containing protein [Bacillota bacterium]|nr:CNNM domain-containing protein [Bacillota bacterium]